MKTVLIYACNTAQQAQSKAAELEAANYSLVLFENGVAFASADFRQIGGDENPVFGSFWIVVGTKAE
jgi:hypothetical protein